jgi:hypothetical protein
MPPQRIAITGWKSRMSLRSSGRSLLRFELAGRHRVTDALGACPAMLSIVRMTPTATKFSRIKK